MKKKKKLLQLFLLFFLIGIFLPSIIPKYSTQAEVQAATTLAAPKITSVKANNSSSITIKWNSVSGATGYRIYRKTSTDTSWTRVTTLTTANTLSYKDTGLKMGITYTYTVRAYKLVNNEKNWGSYNKTGVSATTIIPKPASLTATATSKTSATIKWSTVSGASGYRIYRKQAGVDTKWVRINILSGKNNTTYIDNDLSTGRKYSYTVLAYKTVNNKKVLGKYDTTGVSIITPMTTPKLVSLTSSDSKTATLTWKKTSGVDGYTVYRKASGGKWTKLKNIKGASVTSYTDKTLTSGITYTYTVRAFTDIAEDAYHRSGYNKTGLSVTSKTAKIKNITATANTSSIKITWTKNNNTDGYRVYRRTKSGSWERLTTLSSSATTTYTDKTAKTGTTYYYTVRGYKTINGSKLWGYYDKTGISAIIKTSSSNTTTENPTLSENLSLNVGESKLLTLSGTSNTIEWSKVELTNDGRKTIQLTPSGNNSVLVQGVRPGKAYIIAKIPATGKTFTCYCRTEGTMTADKTSVKLYVGQRVEVNVSTDYYVNDISCRSTKSSIASVYRSDYPSSDYAAVIYGNAPGTTTVRISSYSSDAVVYQDIRVTVLENDTEATAFDKLTTYLKQHGTFTDSLYKYQLSRYLPSNEEIFTTSAIHYNPANNKFYFYYKESCATYTEEISFSMTASQTKNILVTYTYSSKEDESYCIAKTSINKSTYTGENQTFTLKEAKGFSNKQITNLLTRASNFFDSGFCRIELEILTGHVTGSMKSLGFVVYSSMN